MSETESEKQHIFGLIMAGGTGSRIGPYGSQEQPKQLLPIDNDQSLIKNTYERTKSNIPIEHIYISTTKNLEEKIKYQFSEISPENLIVEPESRNTLAAFAYNSLLISLTDSEAIIASIPSDHVIKNPSNFIQGFETAIQATERYPEKVIFLGVKTKNPETSLGYIKSSKKPFDDNFKNILQVDSFTEKPNLETAQKYYRDPKYLWNTANYFFKASTILKMIEKYQPETSQILNQIKQLIIKKEPNYQQNIKDLYLQIPQKQIADAIFTQPDFKDALVVPVDVDWADLGTWKSIYDFFIKNKKEYQKKPTKNFSLKDHGCLILNNTDKPITTFGLKNIVIAYTPNGTLIIHKKELSNIDPYLKKFNSNPKILEINNIHCKINNQTDKNILSAGLKNLTIEQTSIGLLVTKPSVLEKLKQKIK